jgi:hypothetical protein
MPIYEYECPEGHRTERIVLSIHQRDMAIPCNYCSAMAELTWSRPGNINLGKPTRIFINNANGEIMMPQTVFDKPPRGYHEKELKNPIERSKFEKEQQVMVDARNETISYSLDGMKAESRKNRHDDLKARMNAVQRDIDPNTGQEVSYTLTHQDKALLKKAMDKSTRKKFRDKKSNVMLSVNHQNANNMDEVK